MIYFISSFDNIQLLFCEYHYFIHKITNVQMPQLRRALHVVLKNWITKWNPIFRISAKREFYPVSFSTAHKQIFYSWKKEPQRRYAYTKRFVRLSFVFRTHSIHKPAQFYCRKICVSSFRFIPFRITIDLFLLYQIFDWITRG